MMVPRRRRNLLERVQQLRLVVWPSNKRKNFVMKTRLMCLLWWETLRLISMRIQMHRLPQQSKEWRLSKCLFRRSYPV